MTDQPTTVIPSVGDPVVIQLGSYTTNALSMRALDWYARQCGMDAGQGHQLVAATIEAAVSQLIATAITAYTQPDTPPATKPGTNVRAGTIKAGDVVSTFTDPPRRVRTVYQTPDGVSIQFEDGRGLYCPPDHLVTTHQIHSLWINQVYNGPMADVAAAHIAVRFTPDEKRTVLARATATGHPTVTAYIRHLLAQDGALPTTGGQP